MTYPQQSAKISSRQNFRLFGNSFNCIRALGQGKTKASHYHETLLNNTMCWMMGLTVSKYLHVEGSCSDMLRDIPSTHLENRTVIDMH